LATVWLLSAKLMDAHRGFHVNRRELRLSWAWPTAAAAGANGLPKRRYVGQTARKLS
jgi:hypothetical protein